MVSSSGILLQRSQDVIRPCLNHTHDTFQESHISVCLTSCKVLDREQLSQLLDQLHKLQLPDGVCARAPKYLQLQGFTAQNVMQQLTTAGEFC